MNLYDQYKSRVPLEDLKGLMNVKPPLTIRVNTLKTSREELMIQLKTKGFKLTTHPHHPQSIIVNDQPFSVGATTEYLAGQYMLQDTASMIAVSELAPKPSDLVLDLTAAPGAKTTHLSELMNNEGVVVAIDASKKRLRSVMYNAERMGCDNIIAFNIEGQDVNELGLKFDRVLLDAPCSAEGTLHKNSRVLKKQTPYKQIVKKQLALIEAAIKVLKPGGTLVYSTCAINPDENEGIVNHALNQGLKLLKPLTEAGGKGLGLSKTRRFYPHTTATQGFFIARLIK